MTGRAYRVTILTPALFTVKTSLLMPMSIKRLTEFAIMQIVCIDQHRIGETCIE